MSAAQTVTREARLEAAAQWWAKFQEAEPTEEEVQQWLAWLEEDPDNARSFEQLNDLAQRVHRTRELAPQQLEPLRPRSRRARGFPVRRLAIAASVLLSVGALGFAAFKLIPHSSQDRYSTAVAGQREVALPDGSRVILGGASSIETVFSGRQRLIRLTAGEAFFEVKPEAGNRPFIVDTGVATVRALGTAFNIRRNERRIAVTVTEGRVQVVRKDDAVELAHAEQLVVEAGRGPLNVRSADPRRATSWREGRLEFADEPLDVVIANVARYSAVPIQASDPALHDITYTGTFVPGHLDSWLGALEQVFGVGIERAEGLTTVRRRRE